MNLEEATIKALQGKLVEGVQDDRLANTISSYKTMGYTEYKNGDNYVALINTSKPDTPVCALFYGRSAKPVWHYRFRDMEELDTYLDKYLTNKAEIEKAKADRREQRKLTKDHNIKIGDIFYTYWGYDQTNSEFYEVVAIRGSRIDLRELACEYDNSDSSWGQDKISPIPGRYVSDEIHTVSARADGTVTNLDGKDFLGLSKYEGGTINVTADGWGH